MPVYDFEILCPWSEMYTQGAKKQMYVKSCNKFVPKFRREQLQSKENKVRKLNYAKY